MTKQEKIGRNDPCPCGSGKKYKKCCEEKDKYKKFDAKVLSSSSATSVAGALFQSTQSVTNLYQRNVRPLSPTEAKDLSKGEKDQSGL